MAFMHIAIGAIAIGVILMVGFLVMAQVRSMMPSDEMLGNDTNFTASLESSQAIIISGFGLLAIGILVLVGFGLVTLFK